MRLQSKIRHIFTDELLSLTASVCDTKRIDSSQEKMKILADLLYSYDIKFSLLGGATNRLVLFIDGYAVKFALDSQGYRDNLIEYSICEELQPYVTKAYETNGYILIAECVRTVKETDFIARKQDMLNILMTLSDDYLLGDVGYIKKNHTNWGIRDNGELVILDYAYCHRATEELFTCSVCGEGILTYDHVFEKLCCTNKSVCHAVFTYDDKKSEQGDQVDLDMIEERKRLSLVLPKGVSDVELEDTSKGRFVMRGGRKVIVVDNDQTYYEMMKEREKMITLNFNAEGELDVLIESALNGNVDELVDKTVIQDTSNLLVPTLDVDFEIDPDYLSERIGRSQDKPQKLVTGPFSEESENDESEEEIESSIDDLLSMIPGINTSGDIVDDALESDSPKLGVELDGVEL